MRRALPAIALLAAACSSSLPPEGEVRLFIDTDAILPPAPGEDDGGQMALFDRLRIEIFPPGATAPCAECTREFGIDRRTVLEGKASVGIAPPVGEHGHRVRVRLYRSSGADVVEPRPASTLEAVVALPAIDAEGIVDVHVALSTNDLGHPQGTLDAPIDARPGPAAGGLAGTWAADLRKGCAGAPQDGEVCVPGGAFWMGDPSFGAPSERLVVLSPFYLDATEVTVGHFRAAGFSTPLVHGSTGTAQLCTFTMEPGEFEDHALSCVPRPLAEAYCASRGATLPSEAQWELAATGRRSTPYVWGTDAPACEFAVFARFDPNGKHPELKKCAALGVGPQPPGTGTRDRLVLDGGTIVDLEGNLSEWMRDDWEAEGEPCWTAPLLTDPVCVSDAYPLRYSIRGSEFASSAARASERTYDEVATVNTGSAQIGFRCARSGI